MNALLNRKDRDGSAEITVPSSKSELIRMLICAALSDRETTIECLSLCEDVEVTIAALTEIGAKINVLSDSLTVFPVGSVNCSKQKKIDLKTSGAAYRFLVPLCAMRGIDAVFTGDASLFRRPLDPLKECLSASGTVFSSIDETTLSVKGKPDISRFKINGSVSSQFVSGMLLSLPALGRPAELIIEGENVSAPYIELTLDILKRFGIEYNQTGSGLRTESNFVSPGRIKAGGDWSAAAFWIIAGAIGTRPVKVSGLSPDSKQGDRKIVDLMSAFSANVETDGNTIVSHPSESIGTIIDAKDCPDLVPALCVLASVAKGRSVFKNVDRLRFKESDRIEAIISMLRAINIKSTYKNNSLTVYGGKPESGIIDSRNDHRIAMAGSLYALITGRIEINGAECVKKSDPLYFERMNCLSDITFTEDNNVRT